MKLHIVKLYWNLPKLDFNLLQSLHKKESSHIARLVLKSCNHINGKYLGMKKNIKENDFFMFGLIQAKLLAITTVIDDMYDACGTPAELELFTDAIERYDR